VTLKQMILASALSAMALPAMAQVTTVSPGGITTLPPGSVTVNTTGQDTFVTGGSQQTVTGNNPTANASGGAGGQGGRGGRAVVTNNNTITAGGAGGAAGGVGGGYPSTIRNTPATTLALATAYCQNNGGATGSGPGFSFGLALGKHDIDCKRVNYAMLLEAMGDREAALLVIANNPEVNAALQEAARQRGAVRQVAQPVAMKPATSREPRPSTRDCSVLRGLRDPRQDQRDYLAANCG
jgi:hypothetical protein